MASLSSGTSDRVKLTKTTSIWALGLGLGLRLGLGSISREKELTKKAPCLYLSESIVRLSGGSVSLKAPQFTTEQTRTDYILI